ncbi:TrbL/VirB6 plasmid conjugal transfer family protein, partial [Reticulomyxa filosa]
YAVVKDKADITESSWIDIPTTIFANNGEMQVVVPPTLDSGLFFIRIKPLSPPAGFDVDSAVYDLYTNPAHRFGQYYVVIQKKGQAELARFVKTSLLGDKATNKTGVVEKIFVGVAEKNIKYIQTIRALLILYIIFYAIMFMMGTTQLDQQDVIKRLFKIGVLTAVISPNSWSFFSFYFINLFIYGGLDLMGFIVKSSFGTNIVDLQADPLNVFGIFDWPASELLSEQTWKKIYALIWDCYLKDTSASLLQIRRLWLIQP